MPENFYLALSLVSRSHNSKESKTHSLPPSPCTRSSVTAIDGCGGAQTYASGFVVMQEGNFFPPQQRTPFFLGPTCLLATLIKNEEGQVRRATFSTTGQGAVSRNAFQRLLPTACPRCPRWAVCLKDCHGNDNLRA